MGIFLGIIVWIILCFVVANGAQKRGRSFGGYFALSLFLSPLIGMIVLFLLGETDKARNEKVVEQIHLNFRRQMFAYQLLIILPQKHYFVS
jgi:hypothetical protein